MQHFRGRQSSCNLALDGCVACVRPAWARTSRLLDPTSVRTCQRMESTIRWVIVSFKRFLSVKALSPRSGKCLIVVLLCTFSCTLNFEHCQRRHTCVVLPEQRAVMALQKHDPAADGWTLVRSGAECDTSALITAPAQLSSPAPYFGRQVGQIMGRQQTGTTPPRICTLTASSC